MNCSMDLDARELERKRVLGSAERTEGSARWDLGGRMCLTPPTQGRGQDSFSLGSREDQQRKLHSQYRVSQHESNKTQQAAVHSTGNPPHTHSHACTRTRTHAREPPLPEPLPPTSPPDTSLQTHPWGEVGASLGNSLVRATSRRVR